MSDEVHDSTAAHLEMKWMDCVCVNVLWSVNCGGDGYDMWLSVSLTNTSVFGIHVRHSIQFQSATNTTKINIVWGL